jgi:hypothetical protein
VVESDNRNTQADDFKVWTAGQPKSANHMGLVGVTVKLGPKVCKTAAVAKYGDGVEVRKRELRIAKHDRQGGQFDFGNPIAMVTLDNEEIDALLALINENLDHPGRYRVIDAESPAALLNMLYDRPDELQGILARLSERIDPELVGAALAQTEGGLSGAEVAVILRRRRLLEQASHLARQSETTEPDMQDLVGKAHWIFGGQYVGLVRRRNILSLDEHDIPLVCSDGSLHIVELKGPVVPSLLKRHRNHWIVGNEVHEAAMQAVNYIRTADELGAGIQRTLSEELGIDIDLRRVFATVVIGHREHLVAGGMPTEQFDVALRTYNAALNRVQVITYDQLFDAAARSLEFDGA